LGNKFLTSYARTTFNLADPTGITGLTLRMRALDGAAVFVNGKLAYNDNLPAALEPDLGALLNRSGAAEDIVREFRVSVPAGMLVAGTNVVAVEFHKYAPGSSYLAFDTDLSLGLPSSNTPPPDAPTGLAATGVTGPKVHLTWNASVGAVSYNVYRDGGLLGSAATTAFDDASPPIGSQLSYTVRAVDAVPQESTDSTAAVITLTPPAAPTALHAAVVAGPVVQLTWNASAGATSYRVFRNGSLLTTVTTTSYDDTSPPSGTFAYTVRALDGIGLESGDSNTATADLGAPDTTAPSVPGKPVAGAVTASSVAMSWAASTDNVGVAGYRIYRDGAAVATSPTPSYTDDGLSPSTTYKYKVAAFDAAGNQSAKSTALSVTTASSGNVVLGPSTPWSYTDSRVDLGTAWKDPSYVVTSPLWKSGPPQFGFGDGDETTLLHNGGTTSKTATFTWYFRTTFNVADPNLSGPLSVGLVRDDGAVVYVNGVEVFRSNMPAGAPTFTTKASASVGGADEKNPIPFSVPAGALVAGQNVIAVEIHNAVAANADLSFALTGTLP
jgi:hypothetical protein